MKDKANMETDSEEENFNQHRRQGLEGLDEVRNRQNRLSQATKRGNGESPSRIHEPAQVEPELLYDWVRKRNRQLMEEWYS
jgi:hypothetical protein